MKGGGGEKKKGGDKTARPRAAGPGGEGERESGGIFCYCGSAAQAAQAAPSSRDEVRPAALVPPSSGNLGRGRGGSDGTEYKVVGSVFHMAHRDGLGAAEASLSWSVIHGRVECLIGVLVVDGVLLPIHGTSGAGFKPISRLRGCRPSDHNKGRQGVKKQQGARRGGFWLVIICKIK